MSMDKRATAALLFLLLLSVALCTAVRIPASLGKSGHRQVSSVVTGDDELRAVINLQYHTQRQHLIRPMRESGDAGRSAEKNDACRGLNGVELSHCQTLRFERFLAVDYKDAEPNVNVVLAPLPS